MIDGNNENQETNFPVNKLEELEKKINTYSSLRTKVNEETEDEFASPDGEIKIEMPQTMVLVESGTDELRIPGVEEMQNDFAELAILIMEKQEADAIPSSLWVPLKELMEKYLASEAAPRDVDARWKIFAPVYEAFVKYEDILSKPNNGVIGGTTKDWIMGVDREMGENLPRLTASK